MKVGEALARVIKDCGAQHLFTLTGAPQDMLLALDQTESVALVLGCSERSMLAMADGYARYTGGPAFTYAQFGPGVTALVGGLSDALWGFSPVVSIASGVGTAGRFRFAYQEVDQQAVTAPVVKWTGFAPEAARARHPGTGGDRGHERRARAGARGCRRELLSAGDAGGAAMRWLAIVMLAAGATDMALAQNYPARPVRMIVPWPAGGQTDVITRAVAEAMREPLGQQIIVDNRGGAAGRIGSEIGARAAPDGYTVTVANGASHIIAMAIYRNPTYDTLRDFAPVVTLAEIPGVLAVHPGVPVRSVADLVALAKAQPGRINYATAGAGSGGHLLGVRLASVAGITLNHIPYKGEAPAITDAIGGQVQVIFASTLKPHIDAGQLRAIATLGKSRFAQLPELPTLIELGYKELWLITWAGLTVPAKTPTAVVTTLNRAANTALAAPRVRKSLADNGYTTVGGPPEVLGEFMRTEISRYRKVIADFNLTFD